MKKKVFLPGILFLFTLNIHAGAITSLPELETAMRKLFDKALAETDDSLKTYFHFQIGDLLAEALLMPGSFEYPFDSLKRIGKISSPDGKLRLFTWNLIFTDGKHRCYGIVCYKEKSLEKPLVFRLNDCSASLTDPHKQQLGPETWYGALYYEIIERKWQGTTVYTLLGFNPHDQYISIKIIDCLYFTDKNLPFFGAPVFKAHNVIQHRMIFQYAARVSMSLRFNSKTDMIVFDHLSPAKPSYAGKFQFYGPDLSFDGLKFEDGCWHLTEDIDVRN
jgi:hypothetical protein